MKNLKNFFSQLNSSLPNKLRNYELSLEKSYEVYKLNSSKIVVLYSVISENEIENIKGSFIYFLEPTSSLELYVYITNKLGEKVKILIGNVLTDRNGTDVYLNLTNYGYKSIHRFLRKLLGGAIKGRATYTIKLSNETYELKQYIKYPISTKKENYEVLFNNGTKRNFDKEYSFNALDIMIKNNLKIEEVCVKTVYDFQNQPKTLNLIN